MIQLRRPHPAVEVGRAVEAVEQRGRPQENRCTFQMRRSAAAEWPVKPASSPVCTHRPLARDSGSTSATAEFIPFVSVRGTMCAAPPARNSWPHGIGSATKERIGGEGFLKDAAVPVSSFGAHCR